jgi:hypothetical protein
MKSFGTMILLLNIKAHSFEGMGFNVLIVIDFQKAFTFEPISTKFKT